MLMDIPLPPWEEVLPRVCGEMKVKEHFLAYVRRKHFPPDPLTLEWLTRDYGARGTITFTDHDVIAIRARLTDVLAAGNASLSDYKSALEGVLARKCARGEYDHMPVADIEHPSMPADAIYADSIALSGWVVSCGVGSSDDPRIAELRDEIFAIGRKCKQAINEYLLERNGGSPK
jgi:hypothetical protein